MLTCPKAPSLIDLVRPQVVCRREEPRPYLIGAAVLGEGGSCDDCAPSCNGDINADGTIDVLDLLGMLGAWDTCP